MWAKRLLGLRTSLSCWGEVLPFMLWSVARMTKATRISPSSRLLGQLTFSSWLGLGQSLPAATLCHEGILEAAARCAAAWTHQSPALHSAASTLFSERRLYCCAACCR